MNERDRRQVVAEVFVFITCAVSKKLVLTHRQ